MMGNGMPEQLIVENELGEDIDEQEYDLWRQLKDIKGVDTDGDGKVDEDERYVQQQMAGRRLMVEKFVGL